MLRDRLSPGGGQGHSFLQSSPFAGLASRDARVSLRCSPPPRSRESSIWENHISIPQQRHTSPAMLTVRVSQTPSNHQHQKGIGVQATGEAEEIHRYANDNWSVGEELAV
jgi:hypothetical protein